MEFDVLIVGMGHGGAQAAIALRQNGFAGSIAMIGDEPELPYERPPLSKEYLAGEKSWERLLIRPPSFWEERKIQLMPGRSIQEVHADQSRAVTADGEEIGYREMIWAAGGSPRRLLCPGGNLPGVHHVRSRADVDRMMAALPTARQVAVIGGGYIGLEAAAVLRKLGKPVTLIEALDRVLARVAAAPLSRFFEQAHRAQGVDVRLGVQVEAIEESDGAACAVRLSEGGVVSADMVVVGIGIIPNVTPLLKAGAEGANGVTVDRQCRTTLPGIYAVGDCALHHNAFAGGAAVRIESVQNAHDQANVAARTICGQEAAYDAVPWFWSNQYDLKLQTVGLSLGHDEILLRGDPDSRSFSLLYRKEGRVIALDCVNRVRDYVQGRKLVVSGAVLSAASLSDSEIPLKELA